MSSIQPQTETLHTRRNRKWIWVATLAVAIAAGLAALWEHALKDRIVPKRWGAIEEGALYRSGQLPAPLLRRVLARHGIRVVVDMTSIEPDNVKQAAESRLLAELQITLVRCPLNGDGTGDPIEYARALTALVHARRDGEPALVHCQAGSQRTGGVVAAYRLLFEKRPPEAVRAELRRYGWRPGRDRVLTDYLDAHLPEIAALLAADRILPDPPPPLPRLTP